MNENNEKKPVKASILDMRRRENQRRLPGVSRGKDGLTDQDRACIDRYVVYQDMTRAWREVFRAGQPWDAGDSQRASSWFRRSAVAKYYASIRYSQKYYDEALRRATVQEAHALATSRINRLMSWDEDGHGTLTPSADLADADAAAIQGLKVNRSTRTQKDGTEVVDETITLKLADKVAAVSTLAKLQGMNRETEPAGVRFQVNVLNGYAPKE